jgi:hypothetical protein
MIAGDMTFMDTFISLYASRQALDMVNYARRDLMFDSGISANIVIGHYQRPVDANLTRKNIIKHLDAFDLLTGADFWLADIFQLGATCCGLRDAFFLPAIMALLKRAFFCKRAMRDPIPEGLDLQGLNLRPSF